MTAGQSTAGGAYWSRCCGVLKPSTSTYIHVHTTVLFYTSNKVLYMYSFSKCCPWEDMDVTSVLHNKGRRGYCTDSYDVTSVWKSTCTCTCTYQ